MEIKMYMHSIALGEQRCARLVLFCQTEKECIRIEPAGSDGRRLPS
jgi:hypothetical protein